MKKQGYIEEAKYPKIQTKGYEQQFRDSYKLITESLVKNLAKTMINFKK